MTDQICYFLFTQYFSQSLQLLISLWFNPIWIWSQSSKSQFRTSFSHHYLGQALPTISLTFFWKFTIGFLLKQDGNSQSNYLYLLLLSATNCESLILTALHLGSFCCLQFDHSTNFIFSFYFNCAIFEIFYLPLASKKIILGMLLPIPVHITVAILLSPPYIFQMKN